MTMEDCLVFAAVGGILAACAATGTGRIALAHILTGLTAAAYALLALYWAFHGAPVAAGACAVIAVIWAWWWWQGRRKRRKRSLKALGHKARARLAAMARNMPKPGPVLRPVPQGAPS